jgi:exosortase
VAGADATGILVGVNPPLLRNLGLAVLIGVLAGVSPHTSATRPIVKIAGGVAVGSLVFVLAAWLRAPQRSGADDATAGGADAGVPLLVWVVLALTALLFLPAATGLYSYYTEDIWTNGHGLFMPLVVVALSRAILRRDSSPPGAPCVWGYVPVAAGLVLLVLDGAVGTLHISVLGLLLLLVGLSLLVLGAHRTRSLAFPLLLIVFLIPLPTSLAMPLGLTEATAAGAASVLGAVGVPVLRDGTVLVMPNMQYGVSANCSGFSAFYAVVAVALVLGYASSSWLRLALLLLAAWPLVALANALRTAGIVVIWEVMGPRFHQTPLHGLSGIAAFWLVMLVLFLMADRRALREAFS